ncbi:MAG: U32 family peptidase [Clostridia bacterium]|nr:U32 family peptidase [Clostridia bacterium]
MSEILSRRIPELLAPAGSPEALDAAIEAGADAVYFGAGDFNARMRAKNFNDAELSSALEKCAQYGVKSYITVNTRLKDSELDNALALIRESCADGADAFIIADPGLARLIAKLLPDVQMHASTQLSCHSSRDAEALSALGFSRMVCPRELSYGEIKELCEKSPLEIEMFVHGAHCVSFSGQCLMSYAMGGRSGNRGMCAQPCRLPFRAPGVANANPLSLKDMCLAGSVEEIIACGVASLKIEGRQKSADYVYGTVKIYRALLDGKRSASPEEIIALGEIFSRDGFTDGYFKGRYRRMLGMRDEDTQSGAEPFAGLSRKIPVDVSLRAVIGERTSFNVSDGKRSAASYGGVVRSRESGSVMLESAAKEKAAKLGSTPFVLRNFDFKIDPDASFSLSELNALRREAIRLLVHPEDRDPPALETVKRQRRRKTAAGKKLLTAEFTYADRIPEEAYAFFDRMYISADHSDRCDGDRVCAVLSPLTFDRSYPDLEKTLGNLRGEVLVHTFGQAAAAKEAGLSPAASFRFNVMNSYCAEEVLEFADSVTISPEAPSALAADIEGDVSVIVYGKLPLMLTERCAISDGGEACPFGGTGGRSARPAGKRAATVGERKCDGSLCSSYLEDRTGVRFPVIGLPDCSNVIFNSVPIYMADKRDFLKDCPSTRLHFIFTDESPDECRAVIEAYKNGDAASGGIRRIR